MGPVDGAIIVDNVCNGTVNGGGCGCREKSGGNMIIDYNITAVRADHEGVAWSCEPLCYDGHGFQRRQS